MIKVKREDIYNKRNTYSSGWEELSKVKEKYNVNGDFYDKDDSYDSISKERKRSPWVNRIKDLEEDSDKNSDQAKDRDMFKADLDARAAALKDAEVELERQNKILKEQQNALKAKERELAKREEALNKKLLEIATAKDIAQAIFESPEQETAG